MKNRRNRRILGILILLVSLILLIWGIWPFATQVNSVPVNPADMQLPSPEGLIPGLTWVV